MNEDVGITAPRLCVETITPSLAFVIFSFLGFNHTRRRHNASFHFKIQRTDRRLSITKLRHPQGKTKYAAKYFHIKTFLSDKTILNQGQRQRRTHYLSALLTHLSPTKHFSSSFKTDNSHTRKSWRPSPHHLSSYPRKYSRIFELLLDIS